MRRSEIEDSPADPIYVSNTARHVREYLDLAPWKALIEATVVFHAAIVKGRSECECGEVPCEHVSASDELLVAIVALDKAASACGLGADQ